jgi:hypothetical protein
MARIHLDRLAGKYHDVRMSGNNYASLVRQIVHVNTDNVQRKLAQIQDSKWKHFARNYRPSKDIRMVLPDLSEVLPKRAISALKSAEKGKMLRDTLRDDLTKALRERLITTQPSMVAHRGQFAGRVSTKVVQGFEEDITKVFEGYTKSNPDFGMPTNIHTIAVTEVRSTSDMIKNEYTQQLAEKNKDLVFWKVWIRNPRLSNVPRFGHGKVDGQMVLLNELFTVPVYRKIKGKYVWIKDIYMKHPHDPSASADQVIGCNCDYDIRVTKRKRI